MARIPQQVLEELVGQTKAMERMAPEYRRRLKEIGRASRQTLLNRLVSAQPGSFTESATAQNLIGLEAAINSVGALHGQNMADLVKEMGQQASSVGRQFLTRQMRAWSVETNVAVPDFIGAGEALAPGLLEHYQQLGKGWSSQSIREMRAVMSEGILTGQTVTQTANLMATKLSIKPYEAERIVRTEISTATHRKQLADMVEFDAGEGEWRKQLVTAFDNRTEEDSVVVHEQVRKLDQLFNSPLLGNKKFDHPPDRPNDRGTMVFLPIDLPEQAAIDGYVWGP